jgi:hypothetical protein
LRAVSPACVGNSGFLLHRKWMRLGSPLVADRLDTCQHFLCFSGFFLEVSVNDEARMELVIDWSFVIRILSFQSGNTVSFLMFARPLLPFVRSLTSSRVI